MVTKIFKRLSCITICKVLTSQKFEFSSFDFSYEKIRVVGKGAFGNAVLYRRKDDGLMCIIKEINMLDLNASDRQMALNEVKVLAKMDHPNIVAYHDSFEKDGILMIGKICSLSQLFQN